MSQATPNLTPSRRHRANVPLWSALLATVIAAVGLLGHHTGQWTIPGLAEAELATVDARFVVRGPQPPQDQQIVIVGFDDRLRQTSPDVFQRRAGWATFLRALATCQPRAVGLDAFFTSPELPLPAPVTQAVATALGQLTPEETARSPAVAQAQRALLLVQDAVHGDDALADALRASHNVLLPLLFFLDRGESQPASPGAPEPPGCKGARLTEGVVTEAPAGQRPPRAEAAVYSSLPILAAAAAGAGAVNVLRDSDGKVRRVLAVIEHGERYYQPLGLSLAQRADAHLATSYVTGDQTLQFGAHALPVDQRGAVTLNFLAADGGFRTYSAADVLAGTLPRDALKDKLVLVGYTDAARDRLATPFDTAVPGVQIHATLAHNALHDELLRRTPGWASALALLLMGALLTAAQVQRVRQRRAWLAGLLALGLALGWLALSQALFADRWLVDVAGPLGGIIFIALAATSTALATEGREKAHLRAAFSQYVSGSLVERLLDDPSRVQLGGERRELSVLFSDIRGFSSFSEKMEPEQLSAFLNEYLTPMTRIVLEQGGMLDKYIGDAVMAVYGAPLPQADHAAAACRSALAMQKALAALNATWLLRQLPELHIGVGINTGMMSVGNMGSEMRFDYTVMGDAVNLASRLEALTKELRCGILCGPLVPAQAGTQFVFREVDNVRVKGRGGALAVFELCGTVDDCPLPAASLTLYGQALAAYRQRQWPAAQALIADFLAVHPQDGPALRLSGMMAALAADPPPADWDGVYDQHSK
jgi:adenylate cyclase